MKLQLDNLTDIDPKRVPLPHGTEVTTLAAKTIGERTIKTGAIGRVVGIDGEKVRVHVVGVGEVDYSRQQLHARKPGQLAFAMRRAAIAEALSGTIVLDTVVGSRAWGLAEADSDTDRRGIFVWPFEWTIGLVDTPEDFCSADGSENYWEVEKAFRQGVRADPNTLETIMLPGAVALDEIGEWILQSRNAFASVAIYGSFGRYALSQLKRLRDGLRLAEHRAILLEWLSRDALSLNEAAARLVAAAEIDVGTDKDNHQRAKQYIKQLYSSMYDQGLLSQRDFPSLVAFARDCQHKFDLPRHFRPKNAYNLLRLLATATGWLRTGVPEFTLTGALRDEILAVKRQEVALPDVIERAQVLAQELEAARAESKLPAHPDVGAIDDLLRRIRREVARRWHDKQPGAFGRDAPQLPLAKWTT